MSKKVEKGQELFIISYEGSSVAEYRELITFMKPFIRDKNIWLTSKKLKPNNPKDLLDGLKDLVKHCEAMVKEVDKKNAKIEKGQEYTPEQAKKLRMMAEKAEKELGVPKVPVEDKVLKKSPVRPSVGPLKAPSLDVKPTKAVDVR